MLFDTQVVDVTEHCTDPVETLMKVQLGGGTDIGQALSTRPNWSIIPQRTIVALITDFYEGAPLGGIVRRRQRSLDSGVTLLGLAALDERAKPNYDQQRGGEDGANRGAHVAAMTPGELAAWVAEKVRR